MTNTVYLKVYKKLWKKTAAIMYAIESVVLHYVKFSWATCPNWKLDIFEHPVLEVKDQSEKRPGNSVIKHGKLIILLCISFPFFLWTKEWDVLSYMKLLVSIKIKYLNVSLKERVLVLFYASPSWRSAYSVKRDHNNTLHNSGEKEVWPRGIQGSLLNQYPIVRA